MDGIETLKQWVMDSDNIVFFGGAGVSTESGIPDFRSVDGLYNQKYDYPPEVLEYVREKRRQPFVGQAQEYFLCRLHADAPEPVLDDREFCDYKWIAPAEFKLEWLPEFKKKVYARVLEDFFNVRARDK